MTQQIEVIYNAAVADEKLKDGTKYERLTAIVFKVLQESANVVHDVRLRGDGKQTPHQIDVQISSGPKQDPQRILVECKDHGPDTKVDLPEIRNFNGALIQLKPTRGIFVTTSDYTAPARTYAREENITLVELRPFAEQDWNGRLRQINLNAQVYTLGTPVTQWMATGRTVNGPVGATTVSGGVWLDSATYYDENGDPQGTLAALLDEWRRNEVVAGGVPMDGTLERSGTYLLPTPIWLPADDILAEVTGFNWQVPVEHVSKKIEINEGERIADLILRSVHLARADYLSDAISAQLDSRSEKVFFRDQITPWTVDEDHVIRLRLP